MILLKILLEVFGFSCLVNVFTSFVQRGTFLHSFHSTSVTVPIVSSSFPSNNIKDFYPQTLDSITKTDVCHDVVKLLPNFPFS